MRQRTGATRLGDDRGGQLGADAGDLIEPGGRGQHHCVRAGAGVRAGGAASVDTPGVPDGGEALADAGGEPGDPGIEEGDLVRQYLGQLTVMVFEHAGQRLSQGAALGTHRTAGQPGQHLRVTFPRDQCGDHVLRRDGGQLAGHRRDLDQRVFQQFFQPLPAPGPVLGQVGAGPGVMPQRPDLRRRHERRPEQPFPSQPGQPHRVQLVGLGPAGQLPGLAGGDQLDIQPGFFQHVIPDPPVVAGNPGSLDSRLPRPVTAALPVPSSVADGLSAGPSVTQIADRRDSSGHYPSSLPLLPFSSRTRPREPYLRERDCGS